MKLVQPFLWPLIVLLLASCSTISVNTDYDPNADFSGLNTFAIGSATNKDDVLLQNPLILHRVNQSIKTTMEAKGYSYITDNPDMLIYPHASTKEKISVTDWGGGYGGWWGTVPYGWGYGSRIDVQQYTEGYLILDVVTPKDKQLVWRGIGSFTVSSKEYSPQERQECIDEIVGEILEKYPPQ